MIHHISKVWLCRCLAGSALLLTTVSGAHAAEPVVESALDNDPKLPLPGLVKVFAPELKPLWLKALARPEADLQRQAADTLARAHMLGMKGLQDTAPALRKALNAEKAHPIVRLAAARTLIALDAREAAADLFQHLDDAGAEYAVVVEPALAQWDYRPIRRIWLGRLSESRPRRSLLRLAIRGLAIVRESEASAKLWALAADTKTPPQTRIEAAKALGRIDSQGLLERAEKLAVDGSPRHLIDRMVAALLLERHEGRKTEALLKKLAVDPQAAVAKVAMRRLLKIDPMLTLSVAGSLLSRKDAALRRLACESLATNSTESSVKLLSPILGDPHPDVREFVRSTLRRFATKPELASVVRTEAVRVIRLTDWRGHEQCSLLLAQLDHKPAANQLVELLESNRPEVMEASAWALRTLAVPETLPAMFDKAQRQTANAGTPLPPNPNAFPHVMTPEMGRTEQLVQLFQAFGRMNYKPAIPLLWKFVPKSAPYPEETRAAAIWALGFLESDGPGAKRLATALAGRLADVNPIRPEVTRVRWMSAVSLGRLKAKEQVDVLRKFYKYDGPQGGVGLACRWAIREITNETLPGPSPWSQFTTGWFLEPLKVGPPPIP